MIHRFAVFGPESTGKTRLSMDLAGHFAEPWVPEYVREFWDAHDATIVAADLAAIAQGQMRTEDEAAARARRLVVCDTDLLTNVLWADLLFPGACPDWVREEAERRSRRYTLYLLCRTDLPFEPDPQRCFPDEAGRAMCMALWTDTLVRRRLPFVEIRGGGRQRFESARDAISRALMSRRGPE